MSHYDSQGTVNDFLARVRGEEARHDSTTVVCSDKDMIKPLGVSAAPLHASVANSSPSMSLDASNVVPLTPPEEDVVPVIAGVKLPASAEVRSPIHIPLVIGPGRTLRDSIYAIPAVIGQKQRMSGKNMLDFEPPDTPKTPTQKLMMKLSRSYADNQMANAVKNPQVGQAHDIASENLVVVEGPFPVDEAVSAVFEKEDFKSFPHQAVIPTNHDMPQIQDKSSSCNEVGQDGQVISPSVIATPSSSSMAADFKPSISIASPTISPTPVNVHGEPSLETLDTEPGAIKQATDILASKIADAKPDIKEGEIERRADIEGSREHATYFSAWGTPETRNKAKSRTRKVILSGLPGNADYTFIQSLIHGGAVENMSLNTSSNTAYVLFTTGEACDRYANEYANGIAIKHKGRSLTIFVDKGKDIDVVSSMLDAYLSAGASRVVKASNVDEDWSMRALHRIAEGSDKKRKVEFISDDLRNEARTVTFRFANIADAVSFRNTLRRDSEWEAAEIQFVADPCEKSSGFHFE